MQSGSQKLVIGLTGGIGSGKSTVAAMFTEFGIALVDTDAIAHELTQPNGVVMPAIVNAFGKGYVDSHGGLDRTAMRTLVFGNPVAKRKLEEILHPLIRTIADERLTQILAPYSILVVPLLVESGSYYGRVDRVLVVECNEETQLARVMARGLSENMASTIISSQASRQERLAVANDVIDNSHDQLTLRSQVNALHQNYLALAAKLAKKR